MVKTYYEILEVEPTATAQEIAIARRRLTNMNHPDKVSHLAPEFRELAEKRTKEINTAYDVLKDPQKRAAYDRTLLDQRQAEHQQQEKEIVVSPGSLESAVREAHPGATLRLTAGEHHLQHPLEIQKPLSLIGEGMDDTWVIYEGEAHVIRFLGDGPFAAYDLTFGHYGPQWAHVVDVVGGEIDILRCRFGGGVEEDEPGNRGGSGLRLGGQTIGFVANCEAVENMYGISIEDRAQPTLEANACQGNHVTGINYQGSSSGIARHNTCSANEYDGISVMDQAQPTLEANACQQNKECGINCEGSSSAMVRQNVCSANGLAGISVREQAQPTLEGNTCQHQQTEGSGIGYAHSAAGIARHNVCSGNEGNGIILIGQAHPTLEANTCEENIGAGIAYYEGNAAGIARNNHCSGNGYPGIYVAGQAHPTLEANTCRGNGNMDIYIASTARPILKDL